MTAGTQCDTCRRFGPTNAPGWFSLWQFPGEDEGRAPILLALFGSGHDPLTFCTVKCLAEFAMARSLIEGQAAPEGPAS